MCFNGAAVRQFFFFVRKCVDADSIVLLSCKTENRDACPVRIFRRSIILNRFGKVLTAISVAVMTTVPVLADGLDGIVGADFGGLDSLLMATLLLAFGFFMRKFW